MSASEKLKALEQPISLADPALTYEDNERLRIQAEMTLRNALPQIVAVVGAAEKISDPMDYWDWVTGYAPQCKAALAALEEALTESVQTSSEPKAD